MQSALERDEALALLEMGRTPKRTAALSHTTYEDRQGLNLQAS